MRIYLASPKVSILFNQVPNHVEPFIALTFEVFSRAQGIGNAFHEWGSPVFTFSIFLH